MYTIDLMVEEHENILKFNRNITKACMNILDGGELCIEDFEIMIDFARNYADLHHHCKEEKILFKEMEDKLGTIGVNLIRHGMLVEHDMGRLHINEIEASINKYKVSPTTEEKLNIITNAVSFGKLLKRHIDKENEVVYKYGEENLKTELLESIDKRTKEFEASVSSDQVNRYVQMVNYISDKYKVN